MYDHALKINPNNLNAYFNKGNRFILILGVALELLGEFEKAIIMYDQVLKINPNDFDAYVNKGKRFKLF